MYNVANLEKLSAFGKAAPEAMASFQAFDKAALADGAISKKYKELIAVAVGLTTQCPYCIDVHKRAALDARIIRAEFHMGSRIGQLARASQPE
jgi:AhpD family alkylhydroperoxidase